MWQKTWNFDHPCPACTDFSLEQIMNADTVLTPDTMAELGLLASSELHPSHAADPLGIDLSGPEHDDADPSDFVEVPHD